MYYAVKRTVTLIVEADSREEAIKNSQRWDGESWSASLIHGQIAWNGKSKLISAKASR